MEKEIHRMTLRYESLRREQERLSVEMERAVTKRGSIAVRYGKTPPAGAEVSSSAATLKSSKNDMTQAAARKRIGILKGEARQLAEETSQYNSIYEEKKRQTQETSEMLELVTYQYGETEEKCHALQGEINDLLYQKQLLQERIMYRQKYVNKLKDFTASGGIESSQSLQIERRVLSASQALDNVREIIADLQLSFPHMKEVLQRVDAMTDPSISVELGQ